MVPSAEISSSPPGADPIRECKNTVFVSELRKMAFCEVKVAVSGAFRLRECPLHRP